MFYLHETKITQNNFIDYCTIFDRFLSVDNMKNSFALGSTPLQYFWHNYKEVKKKYHDFLMVCFGSKIFNDNFNGFFWSKNIQKNHQINS